MRENDEVIQDVVSAFERDWNIFVNRMQEGRGIISMWLGRYDYSERDKAIARNMYYSGVLEGLRIRNESLDSDT